MSEHTPGPWEVVASEEYTDDSWGVRRAGETHGMSIAQMCWEQDARLIAAAPDLLAALKALEKGPDCWCEMAIGNPMYTQHSARCAAAREAIAKAEGR